MVGVNNWWEKLMLERNTLFWELTVEHAWRAAPACIEGIHMQETRAADRLPAT